MRTFSQMGLRSFGGFGLVRVSSSGIILPPLPSLGRDALAAEMIGAYAGRFDGWGGVTSWTTDEVVTTPADLAAKINGYRTSTTAKRRLRCAWNGPITDTTTWTGKPSSATGYFDDGGALMIVAEAGYTPIIEGPRTVYGIRGLHVKGIGFTGRRSAISGGTADTKLMNHQTTGTYPALQVAMYEDCGFGTEIAYPGSSTSDYVKSLWATQAVEELHVKKCRFNGYTDGLGLVAFFGRVHGCDFQQGFGDDVDGFGFLTPASVGKRARHWLKNNTFRRCRAISPAHADVYQTGTSGDVHEGYDVLFEENIAHKRWSDVGEGGTQGIYQDDYMAALNRLVSRNNYIACVSTHAVQGWSPLPSGSDMYSYRDTIVPPGEIPPSGSPPYPGYYVSSMDPSMRLKAEASFYGNIWDPPGQLDLLNCQNVDFRAGKPSGVRPETLFKGGAGFVRDGSDKVTYAIPGEAGTQAEFAAGIWSLFEPQPAYAGIGMPDPRGWF